MAGWTQKLSDALSGVLAPPTCPSCARKVRGGEADRLCADCLGEIRRVPAGCTLCGVPGSFPPSPSAPFRGEPLCPACRAGRSFGRARAYGLFDGRLKELVTRLKYRGEQALGEPLGLLLLEADDPARLRDHDLVVPVPLHRDRLAERGFNQAFLLARPLARELRLPLAAPLERAVDTQPQVGLPEDARLDNVRSAFAVRARGAADIAGKAVLLVDDVLTTGATADACARVLLDHGARAVSVIAPARTA